MSQERFREIFEEKARMNGGLQIGGARKGSKCAKKYKSGPKKGKCKKFTDGNPWIAFVREMADKHYNGNYAAALADPATARKYHKMMDH